MSDQAEPSVIETIERIESSRKHSRLKRRFVVAAVLVVSIIAFSVYNSRGPAGTMRFQTRPVRLGDLKITVTATGNLEATNQVDVGSELSGIITKMAADFNDTVKADQPLAYLDDTKYKATVARSKAEVAAAEAAYRETVATHKANDKTLKRYQQTKKLTHGKLPSMEVLEQAEAELERSAAMVEAAYAAITKAKAALKSDETDLKKTVIYSPINGIVLSRDVEVGQTVAASLQAPVLYTLAEDLRRMELQVDVDEADVGLVAERQDATFTVDAYPERTFAARIIQVRYGAETTDGVVTYKTVLSVENPDLLLRPGMTATADIVVQKIENALLVPNAALRFTPPVPGNGKPAKRSLVNSLLPGPPRRHGERKDNNGQGLPPGSMQPCVWILKNNRPVPVKVATIATDGAVTAVRSTDRSKDPAESLAKDMEVIVNAITTPK